MSSNTLRSLTLVALGVCTVGATLPSYAATTASITASSMYLWRGMSISGSGAAVSGDLYYNHDSGAYAGIWTSSEGALGHETDLNVGFTKKFGDFGFDVGIYEYLYPEAQSCASTADLGTGEVTESCTAIDMMDADAREWYVGAILGPVTVKVLVNPEITENKYLTIDAMFGSFGAHIGRTTNDDSSLEYTDVNVSYMPAANLMFTVSKASGDGAEGNEDPLFLVSYKMPFEVK